MTMRWDGNAERTLRSLADMVPTTLRELASAAARDESELVASDRDSDEVMTEDVVRGWIRTTPPEQRNGLVAVIDSLGFEVELFADDLQSAEGWDDDGDEGRDSCSVDEAERAKDLFARNPTAIGEKAGPLRSEHRKGSVGDGVGDESENHKNESAGSQRRTSEDAVEDLAPRPQIRHGDRRAVH